MSALHHTIEELQTLKRSIFLSFGPQGINKLVKDDQTNEFSPELWGISLLEAEPIHNVLTRFVAQLVIDSTKDIGDGSKRILSMVTAGLGFISGIHQINSSFEHYDNSNTLPNGACWRFIDINFANEIMDLATSLVELSVPIDAPDISAIDGHTDSPNVANILPSTIYSLARIASSAKGPRSMDESLGLGCSNEALVASLAADVCIARLSKNHITPGFRELRKKDDYVNSGTYDPLQMHYATSSRMRCGCCAKDLLTKLADTPPAILIPGTLPTASRVTPGVALSESISPTCVPTMRQHVVTANLPSEGLYKTTGIRFVVVLSSLERGDDLRCLGKGVLDPESTSTQHWITFHSSKATSSSLATSSSSVSSSSLPLSSSSPSSSSRSSSPIPERVESEGGRSLPHRDVSDSVASLAAAAAASLTSQRLRLFKSAGVQLILSLDPISDELALAAAAEDLAVAGGLAKQDLRRLCQSAHIHPLPSVSATFLRQALGKPRRKNRKRRHGRDSDCEVKENGKRDSSVAGRNELSYVGVAKNAFEVTPSLRQRKRMLVLEMYDTEDIHVTNTPSAGLRACSGIGGGADQTIILCGATAGQIRTAGNAVQRTFAALSKSVKLCASDDHDPTGLGIGSDIGVMSKEKDGHAFACLAVVPGGGTVESVLSVLLDDCMQYIRTRTLFPESNPVRKLLPSIDALVNRYGNSELVLSYLGLLKCMAGVVLKDLVESPTSGSKSSSYVDGGHQHVNDKATLNRIPFQSFFSDFHPLQTQFYADESIKHLALANSTTSLSKKNNKKENGQKSASSYVRKGLYSRDIESDVDDDDQSENASSREDEKRDNDLDFNEFVCQKFRNLRLASGSASLRSNGNDDDDMTSTNDRKRTFFTLDSNFVIPPYTRNASDIFSNDVIHRFDSHSSSSISSFSNPRQDNLLIKTGHFASCLRQVLVLKALNQTRMAEGLEDLPEFRDTHLDSMNRQSTDDGNPSAVDDHSGRNSEGVVLTSRSLQRNIKTFGFLLPASAPLRANVLRLFRGWREVESLDDSKDPAMAGWEQPTPSNHANRLGSLWNVVPETFLFPVSGANELLQVRKSGVSEAGVNPRNEMLSIAGINMDKGMIDAEQSRKGLKIQGLSRARNHTPSLKVEQEEALLSKHKCELTSGRVCGLEKGKGKDARQRERDRLKVESEWGWSLDSTDRHHPAERRNAVLVGGMEMIISDKVAAAGVIEATEIVRRIWSSAVQIVVQVARMDPTPYRIRHKLSVKVDTTDNNENVEPHKLSSLKQMPRKSTKIAGNKARKGGEHLTVESSVNSGTSDSNDSG